MQVSILYFASLREALRSTGESLQLPEQVRTAGELRRWLIARGEPFAQALAEGKAVRVSVEQLMATPDTPLTDGAEVAFFPPVTGG